MQEKHIRKVLQNIFPLLLLFGIIILFFREVLCGEKTFCINDNIMHLRSFKQIIAKEWKNGSIPLWNPYIYCGIPLFADVQVFVFHPTNLILLLLPFSIGYDYFITLHTFLSGIFTYIFLRGENLSKYASLLGGIIFSLNCYLLAVMGTPIFFSVCYMPLTIFLFSKALVIDDWYKKFIFISLTGLGLSLQFLSGDPENIHFTIIVLLIISLFKIEVRRVGVKIKNILTVFISAGIIGLLLSAVQLIPTFELFRLSTRLGGLGYDEAVLWSFHPLRVVSFFIPYFFGRLLPSNTYWGTILENGINNTLYLFIQTAYCGVFVLILAISVVLSKRNKGVILWSVIGLFFLLLSFGKYTPLYYLLYKYLPLFDSYRYPIKSISIVAFSLSVLASLGWEHFFETKKEANYSVCSLRNLLIISVLLSIIVLGLYLAFTIFKEQSKDIISHFVSIKDSKFSLDDIIEISSGESLKVFQFLLIGTIILILGYLKVLKFHLVKIIFFALILVDILYFNSSSNLVASRDIYNDEKYILKLINNIDKSNYYNYRICHAENFWYDNLATRDEREKFPPYQLFIRWKMNTMAPNYGIQNGIFYEGAYLAYKLSSFNKLMHYYSSKSNISNFLSFLNVKYVITSIVPDYSFKYTNFFTVATDTTLNIKILKNKSFLPRVYWVSNAVFVDSEDKSLRKLLGKDFDMFNQVVIEHKDKKDFTQISSAGIENLKSNCEIIDYTLNSIKVSVNALSNGYIVFNEAYYPGWKCKIDGKNAEVLKANYFMRAVYVEKGKHKIELTYSPTSLKIGIFITVITSILLIGSLCLTKKIQENYLLKKMSKKVY